MLGLYDLKFVFKTCKFFYIIFISRVECLHWLLMLWIVVGYIIEITIIIEMMIRTVIVIIKS